MSTNTNKNESVKFLIFGLEWLWIADRDGCCETCVNRDEDKWFLNFFCLIMMEASVYLNLLNLQMFSVPFLQRQSNDSENCHVVGFVACVCVHVCEPVHGVQ